MGRMTPRCTGLRKTTPAATLERADTQPKAWQDCPRRRAPRGHYMQRGRRAHGPAIVRRTIKALRLPRRPPSASRCFAALTARPPSIQGGRAHASGGQLSMLRLSLTQKPASLSGHASHARGVLFTFAHGGVWCRGSNAGAEQAPHFALDAPTRAGRVLARQIRHSQAHSHSLLRGVFRLRHRPG